MDEEDSGYEARSTVTTSNSICQTDLQQLVYNNLENRPATINCRNYSNYSNSSLIVSTSSLNELRSPRSINSNSVIASRPQSSAYSTISSCSLNRQLSNQPQFDQQQQYPRLEEYQPLDQFRYLDQFSGDNHHFRPLNNMSADRSLNLRPFSPDYEQDWSAGEQDEDSDYVIEHVVPVRRQLQIESSSSTNLNTNNRNLNRARFRLLDDLDDGDDDLEAENDDKKENDNQLVNTILNSPLDHTPSSSPLSLPSSNLSNSNESSNNSSPTLPSLTTKKQQILKRQKSKLKSPESSFSNSELSSLESPKCSLELPAISHISDDNNLTSTTAAKNSSSKTSEQPISEEEFTSRKAALRERINNTFRILNGINNNCNRFRTIASRSQEAS